MSRRREDMTAVAAIALGAVMAMAGTSVAVRALRTDGSRARRPVPATAARILLVGSSARVSAVRAVPATISPPEAPAGVAFYASSLGEGLAFEGDYSGRLTWDGSGLEVDLPLVLVRRESVGGRPTHLAGIALALAEDTDARGGWRIVRRSGLRLATGATHTGTDTWLRDVRLRIDGLKEEDLEGRRLVIVQQLDVEDATGSHPAWTYTPADRSLLARLMGGILGGC